MEMFRNLSSQILTNLQDLEGDYRVFNLPIDKTQSMLSMLIAGISILGLLGVDYRLFGNRPELFMWLALYRGGFALFTSLMTYAILKTNKVRVFDRLILAWLIIAILFLLSINFTRPVDYLTTPFDVIVVLAIYVLSPLKFSTNSILALGFAAGTMYIDFFLKSGVDPIALNAAASAQIIVQILGAGSSLQLQSYRRKSFKAFMEEKDAREMVAYLANIDPLTKSLTRRHFFNIAESEFLRFKRYQRPLTVLVIDADRFKSINDTYGHYAGDIVLRSLSLAAMEQKRAQDTFGRLGGEEFGLLMPETTLEQAHIVADRIQKSWEQSPVNLDGELIPSTISIGVAEAAPTDELFDQILRRADQMLYKAKQAGRNRVVSE